VNVLLPLSLVQAPAAGVPISPSRRVPSSPFGSGKSLGEASQCLDFVDLVTLACLITSTGAPCGRSCGTSRVPAFATSWNDDTGRAAIVEWGCSSKALLPRMTNSALRSAAMVAESVSSRAASSRTMWPSCWPDMSATLTEGSSRQDSAGASKRILDAPVFECLELVPLELVIQAASALVLMTVTASFVSASSVWASSSSVF